MASVRRSGTAPELAVAMLLDELAVSYTINDKTLPGSPDFYACSVPLAIFVHGCFWHRHTGCHAASTPKTNTEYWVEKFRDNVHRDKRVLMQLRLLGVRPLVIWQCQLLSPLNLKKRLRKALVVASS